MKPGIYNDIGNAVYHSSDGISKSGLDQVARSPAHYREWLEKPRKQTEAFSIGTEAHRLILEPETKSLALLKPEVARRSNADRTYWLEFFTENGANGAIVELPAAEWDAEFTRQTGRYLLTQKQFDDIRAMRESVYAHPSAAELLENGVAEQTIVWIDEDTGELCRCRPDWVHDECILVDIKTTEDASPLAVFFSMKKWRYHVQAAFYSDGFAAAHNLSEPQPFVFIFVEKAPPYAVGVYVLDRDAMDRGRELYRRDLERLAEAKVSGCWDAYSTEIEMIELPRWAYQS